jgi:hypothetical protein
MWSGNRLGNKRQKHIDGSQLIPTKGFAKQLPKKKKHMDSRQLISTQRLRYATEKKNETSVRST